MAMILLSAILLPMLLAYQQWERGHARSTTLTKLSSSLYKAYSDYFYLNGRYPCPANPTLLPGAANHGRADPALCTGGALAYTGSIPFVDLNIPYELTVDGWNNQFFYAVSNNLVTGTMTSSSEPGTITVNIYNSDLTLSGTPKTTYQFVLLSFGKNGAGAITVNGTASPAACQITGVVPLESENCDGDAVFAQLQRSTWEFLAQGAGYYDDIISAIEGAQARIWANSSVEENDIFSRTESIGIGTDAPTATVDVVGNIRADRFNSDDVCDGPTGDCFNPEIIGGTVDEMDCGDQPMVSIGDASARCGSDYLSLSRTDSCATGYVLGFNADGSLICGYP